MGSMAFLPEKFTGAKERLGMFEFPTDDYGIRFVYNHKITRRDSSGIKEEGGGRGRKIERKGREVFGGTAFGYIPEFH